MSDDPFPPLRVTLSQSSSPDLNKSNTSQLATSAVSHNNSSTYRTPRNMINQSTGRALTYFEVAQRGIATTPDLYRKPRRASFNDKPVFNYFNTLIPASENKYSYNNNSKRGKPFEYPPSILDISKPLTVVTINYPPSAKLNSHSNGKLHTKVESALYDAKAKKFTELQAKYNYDYPNVTLWPDEEKLVRAFKWIEFLILDTESLGLYISVGTIDPSTDQSEFQCLRSHEYQDELYQIIEDWLYDTKFPFNSSDHEETKNDQLTFSPNNDAYLKKYMAHINKNKNNKNNNI